ncbi:MAG: acyl-CoA dehydrogenase family protein [Chloroflexi bacterium]|nr:acyl-CoA dehydrogenase family protein [Chloroflexota bacterium]
MPFELTEEQRLFKRTVRDLSEREFKPHVAQWEESDDIMSLVRRNVPILAQHGLTGLCIPQEYGGQGATTLDWVIAVEEVSRVDFQTAPFLTAVGQPIVDSGTPEQKQRFLPGIAAGELLGGTAVSEPVAGSDVGGIITRAELKDGHWVINGTKCFISNALWGDIFMLAARIGDAPGLKGVGLFILERTAPGYSVGKVRRNMGGGIEAEVYLTDCRLPQENLLLPAGEFRKWLVSHDHNRCGTAASSVGIAQGALDDALDYAQQRVTFGRPIAEYQGIQWMLADMAMKVEAARLLTYRAAASVPKRPPTLALETAMAKCYANEMAVAVTCDAVQIFGCYGLSKEFPVERRFRKAKTECVGGGTTQIMRNRIAAELLQRRLRVGAP